MTKHHRRLRTALAAGVLAVTFAASACAGDTDVSQSDGESASGGSIAEDYDLSGQSYIVGSKEYTEQVILGQIAIAAIQAAGGTAEDKTGITGSGTVRAALVSGEIDLYWEYTGTGWVNILGNTTQNLPQDLFAAVAEADAVNQVTWIGPAPLNNSFGVAIKKSLSDDEDITTISDAAEYLQQNPDEARFCADSEFIQRDDGLPGLSSAYGMQVEVVEMSISLLYPQIGENCALGVVSTTDARIKSNDLVTLEDDKNFFVPYQAALTVRSEPAQQNPDLELLFTEIADALDNETMIDLNGRVDIDGGKESDVAREFLQEQGFID